MIGEIVVPVPPTAEQAAIVAFLDRETGKIDALVEAQRRLIELLKEKRQAAIVHTVFGGTVPYRKADEGLSTRDLPRGCTIGRLSAVCRFSSGKAHEPFIDADGPFICVNARFVSTQGVSRKFCTHNLSPAQRNDILMVMSDLPNGRALARAFFVADDEAYAINQRVCSISVRRGNPKYFYYQLDRNAQLMAYDDGVSQTHLPNDAFTKLELVLPPKSEQDAIATFLDRETAKLDELVARAEAGIALLQERRGALIFAAVTGKFDVRGLAPSEAEAA